MFNVRGHVEMNLLRKYYTHFQTVLYGRVDSGVHEVLQCCSEGDFWPFYRRL